MKKLFCNISSIILGIFASIMAFVPMFDFMGKSDNEISWYEEPFNIFKDIPREVAESYDEFSNGFKYYFKVIIMALIIIAIITVIILITTTIVNFVNKQSKLNDLKKLAGITLLVLAVLIAISTIIFMLSNMIYESGDSILPMISNWFAYLSVIFGYAGSGRCAICAKE